MPNIDLQIHPVFWVLAGLALILAAFGFANRKGG
jgi:hypothetical protein